MSKIGSIITFYSYKGGVGRSMAMANVGALAAMNGKKVLLLDWDLEAPGLEKYFSSSKGSRLVGDPNVTPGIIDILDRAKNDHLEWRDCILKAEFAGTSLDIISAGKKDDDYRSRIQNIDWGTLFEKYEIAYKLDQLRDELKNHYDLILIDSRTGITDIGDICTVLLPDALVAMFVSNFQNVEGTKDLVKRARFARNNLPLNRGKLIALPLLGRDESKTEYDSSVKWKSIFDKELGFLFSDWLPKTISTKKAFAKLYIPYVPFWSFGENIPALQSEYELNDSASITTSYSRVATILESGFDWYSAFPTEKLDLKEDEIELAQSKEAFEIDKKAYRKRTRLFSFAAISAIITALMSIVMVGFWTDNQNSNEYKKNYPIVEYNEISSSSSIMKITLDSKSLVATQSSGALCHHSLTTLNLMYCVEPEFFSNREPVFSWSPDNNIFASGNSDLFNQFTLKGDQLKSDEGTFLIGNVVNIKWSKDSSMIAVATDTGALYILSREGSKEYRLDMFSEYFEYEWSADSKSIFVIANERGLLEWNFDLSDKPEWKQDELKIILDGTENQKIDRFLFNKNETAFYVVDSSSRSQNEFRIFELNQERATNLISKVENVFNAAWGPQGNKIAVVKGNLNRIDIIDINTGEISRVLETSIKSSDRISWSRTGNFLIIIDSQKLPRLLELGDANSNEYELRYEGLGIIEDIVFSPGDEEIITLSNTSILRKYNIEKLVANRTPDQN